MSEEFEKPVSIGDTKDVKIEAVGKKGDGIAKIDNFVIFVPDAKEGEELKVEITKVLDKVAFANKVGKSEKKVETKESKADESEEQPEAEEEAVEDSEEF